MLLGQLRCIFAAFYFIMVFFLVNEACLLVLWEIFCINGCFSFFCCLFTRRHWLWVSNFCLWYLFSATLSFDYNQLFAGTQYTQQSYKVSDSFPFKWINKKWREGFHVTSMATAGSRWGVVMSRNAGFSDQVWLGFITVLLSTFSPFILIIYFYLNLPWST